MQRVENRFFLLLLSYAFLGFALMFPDILAMGLKVGSYKPGTVALTTTILKSFTNISLLLILFQIGELYRWYKIEKRSMKMAEQINKNAELLRKNEIAKAQIDEMEKILNFLMIANSTEEIPFILKKYINELEDKHEKAKVQDKIRMGAVALALTSSYLQAKELQIDLKFDIFSKIDQTLISENKLAAIFHKTLEIAFDQVKQLPVGKRKIQFVIGEKRNTYAFKVISEQIDKSVFNNEELNEMLEEINGKTTNTKEVFEFIVSKTDKKGRPLLYLVGAEHND